jgi:glycosyltransferase involved in cell wall biosynthesis
MREKLTVSFITCTFNSGKILEECLESIKKLDYPKELIEIIVVDGGSKDNTLESAINYNCKIVKENTRRPEAATAIGYNEAKNDIIVNFPSDNVITDDKWLKRMLKPFQENKDLVGVETLRYEYCRQDKSLNRYFALFGAADPVAYYMNKRDRITYFEKTWPLEAKADDMGDYYLVKFNKYNTPTLGANGFCVKRELILEVSGEPLKFFHIDATYDLIMKGHNQFAFVKNTIWHKTAIDFTYYLKNRLRYAGIYFKDQSLRRYHLVDFRRDKLKLFKYIIFTLTIVVPLYEAIKGYLKIRDLAWFYHPLVCLLFLFMYGYTTIKHLLKFGG